MDKDNIRQAFSKVKEDMIYLSNELNNLKYEINEIKTLIVSIQHDLTSSTHQQILPQTHQQTNQQVNTTYSNIPTDNPTVPQEVGGLKTQKTGFSTGNEGVPTDRQTNQQTNQQTENIEQNLRKVNVILDSLDSLKKEIRQKFKRLTPQEMLVFSSIYQMEEQDPDNNTYKEIANNLKLSESSIRDYVIKIINKGIPIKKQKIDNKKVLLSVSPELKRIATLSTIIQLREL